MKITKGSKVSFHYIGTLDNGDEFDNSYERGEPMSCVIGEGDIIAKFEEELTDLSANEKKTFTISPQDGYGEHKSDSVQYVPKDAFPEDMVLEEGRRILGEEKTSSTPFTALIVSVEEDKVKLDFNHPLAGENLNFDVEVVSVE